MSDHHISLSSIVTNSNGHSLFGPSSSKMWLSCSGSLVANALAPDSAGEAAAYGTVGHAVAEQWLKSEKRPDHLLGTVEIVKEGDSSFEITIDEEMLDYVGQYVDWCAYLPGTHYVEQRVDFSDLTPIEKQGGTADHIVCSLRKLIVSDLKMGIGVRVFAENNPQLMIYAYGAFMEHDWLFDFQEIEIRIAQPRLQHFDSWTLTRQQLLDFAAYVKERAHAAWCLDAPRTPGEDQCQWCRVKKDCSAFAVMVERMTDGVFDNLDEAISMDDMGSLQQRMLEDGYTVEPRPVTELTAQQKVTIYRHKSMITRWLDDIGASLFAALESGNAEPALTEAFKLVVGNSSRSFANPQEAFSHLESLGLTEDEIAPRSMLSPAQAETVLVKHGHKRKELPELLDPIVRRSPGNPTMVPITDKRPAISRDAEAFENLDDL